VNETHTDFADSLQNGYKNAEVLLPPHESISSMLYSPPGHIKRHENHGISYGFMPFDLSRRNSDTDHFVAVWDGLTPAL
jgi:hypothetical protein